jgi:hypothetical protein
MSRALLVDDDIPPCPIARSRDYRDLVIEMLADDMVRLEAERVALVNLIANLAFTRALLRRRFSRVLQIADDARVNAQHEANRAWEALENRVGKQQERTRKRAVRRETPSAAGPARSSTSTFRSMQTSALPTWTAHPM